MKRWLVGCAAALIAAVVLAAPCHAAVDLVRPVPAIAQVGLAHHQFVSLPNEQECHSLLAVNCYSAQQLRVAYGVEPLAIKGINGSGTTIAIVVSFGSPTIARDLATFDRALGLPDPPML